MRLLDFLVGRELANSEAEQDKMTTLEGLPAIGLDGLASSACGPEAALAILAPLGALGANWLAPITLAILLVLAMLFVSYWQTIRAYPVNGGSYTVATENLGATAGLLAATALMLDYVLTVAVGISAGIGALTSAVPSLHTHTLNLCLCVLAIVTVINLRGTREAGILFAIPTYLFIASLGGLLAFGLGKAMLAGGFPTPEIPAPASKVASESVTLWLLLRAFASGCTAMTGVEAVSNGVGAFRQPSVKYAHRTLAAIVVILSLLLAGIAVLARAYHVGAMDQTKPDYQSVLSQLAGAVAGHGAAYFVTMGSILAVLCFSANTSFVDFPRLCRLVARDGYLPRDFAAPGRRLVNSVGIIWLALAAGALLTAFDGITDRLIPLYAIGAFLAFTLSQSGMAVHWARKCAAKESWGDRARLIVNATGAIATATSLAIILAAKFLEGAWITALAIPCVLMLFKTIKRYYARLDGRLAILAPFTIGDPRPPIVIIPIRDWNRLGERALRCALRMSPEVIALHLSRLEGPDIEEGAEKLRLRWRDDIEPALRALRRPAPRLVQVDAPFRGMNSPILKFIARTREQNPGRAIAVVIPALAEAHWWELPLHKRRARRLQGVLSREGGANLAVVIVPWSLEDPQPGNVLDSPPEPK